MDLGIISVAFALAGLAVAALGVAFAQGLTIKSAMDGMARQPEAAGKISNSMIIGLAFIESVIIYVLVIALIVFFADPFAKPYNQIKQTETDLAVMKIELERVKIESELAELKARLPAAQSIDNPTAP